MYPWFWLWAPQFHYPLGGNVAQDIDPSFFFAGIKPGAGNPTIERQAFDVASYGKQLGIVTEILLGLAEPNQRDPQLFEACINDLKVIRKEIEEIKDSHYQLESIEIQKRIKEILERGGSQAAALRLSLKAIQ